MTFRRDPTTGLYTRPGDARTMFSGAPVGGAFGRGGPVSVGRGGGGQGRPGSGGGVTQGGGGGGGGGGSWPNNEPPGMTVLIDGPTDGNGSDKYYGAASLTSDGAGGLINSDGWYFGSAWHTNNTRVEAGVSDVDSKYGTVVEKRFFINDDSNWHGYAQYDWESDLGGFDEIYVRTVIKHSSNWETNSGNEKIWYVGGSGGDGADVYWQTRTNLDFYLVNELPGGSGFTDVDMNVALVRDQYQTLEVHFIAESASGASDGSCYAWLDDVLVINRTGDVNWSSATNLWTTINFILFWGGGLDTKTVDDWVRLAEFHLSVK